jgi:predicted dehydrogenase
MIRVSLDATGDSRWLRIGLIPGLGRFTNTTRLFSLATGIWIKAPESRTATVRIGAAGSLKDVERSLYRGPQPRDKKILRWGILSTAHINKSIIPPLRRSHTNSLIAVASRDLGRAQQYAKAWRIPRAFGSYEAMLESDLIDAVYIPLPNHLHAEWAIRAMESGKHVLCEKPLALSTAEVDAIEQTARDTGRIVAEAFMYRHHKRTKAAKKIIDSQVIGTLRSIYGAFTFPLQGQENIRLAADKGGGSLWDVGCYPVSFARYLIGTEPDAVVGFQRLGPTGVDVHFNGQMRFPGGVTAQFESGFDAPLQMTMTIVGSKGTIEIPSAYKPGHASGVLIRRDAQDVERVEVEGGSLYRGELEDFAEAVLYGKEPLISLKESRANVRVLRALYQSAQEERVIGLR